MPRNRTGQAAPPTAQRRQGAESDKGSRASARPRLEAVAHGLACGVCFALSFAPVGFWPAALLIAIAPARLALRVASGRNPLSPASAGFWAAIGIAPWWAFSHWWVSRVSAAGIIPLVILLSAYTMLFVWMGARLGRRFGSVPVLLLLPIVWTACEFLRGSVLFDGYAWYLAAHPVIDAFGGRLAAPASIGGAYLVSALVVLAAGLAVGIEHRRDGGRSIGACVMLLVAWPIAGDLLLAPETEREPVRVAVVQSNLDRVARGDWTFRRRVRYFNHQISMSLAAVAKDPLPDVLLWPESSVPGTTLDPVSIAIHRDADLIWPLDGEDPPGVDAVGLPPIPSQVGATELSDRLLAAQRIFGVPMIVGGTAYDDFRIERDSEGPLETYDRIFNTTFVIEDGRVAEPWYDKRRLTPFGEVMPYISLVPGLQQRFLDVAARGMSFVLSPGRGPGQLTIPLADGREVSAAAPICFEATDPGVCRRLVFEDGQRRAGIMLNLTDDGWFTTSVAGRRAHETGARWRCVELATPLVRSANTGISGAFDARGQHVLGEFLEDPTKPDAVLDRTMRADRGAPARRAGVYVASVPLAEGSTLYARTGDVFAWACLIITGVLLAWSFMPRGKPGGTPNEVSDESSS